MLPTETEKFTGVSVKNRLNQYSSALMGLLLHSIPLFKKWQIATRLTVNYQPIDYENVVKDSLFHCIC